MHENKNKQANKKCVYLNGLFAIKQPIFYSKRKTHRKKNKWKGSFELDLRENAVVSKFPLKTVKGSTRGKIISTKTLFKTSMDVGLTSPTKVNFRVLYPSYLRPIRLFFLTPTWKCIISHTDSLCSIETFSSVDCNQWTLKRFTRDLNNKWTLKKCLLYRKCTVKKDSGVFECYSGKTKEDCEFGSFFCTWKKTINEMDNFINKSKHIGLQ